MEKMFIQALVVNEMERDLRRHMTAKLFFFYGALKMSEHMEIAT